MVLKIEIILNDAVKILSKAIAKMSSIEIQKIKNYKQIKNYLR
jgi:hypothetical protein